MKNLNRGFTLIELLVVITIIALLATVVMVNVSNKRSMALDIHLVTDVQQARNLAALAADSSGDFSSVISLNVPSAGCATGCNNGDGLVVSNPKVAQLTKDAIASGGKLFAVTDAEATKFALFGSLQSQGANTYYCVDSINARGTTTVTTDPSYSCQ